MHYQKNSNNLAATHSAWIGLGTNLGNRHQNLNEALTQLLGFAEKMAISPRYETAPWGITDQPAFYNQVVRITTSLGPFGLLDVLLSIESQMGRQRQRKWGERLIDLDLLVYGRVIVNSERLSVPHPHLPERSFVLRPLTDLDPQLIIPGTDLTSSSLLYALPDAGDPVRLPNQTPSPYYLPVK